MNEFLYHILGSHDIPYTMAVLFFAFLGAGMALLIHATNRTKTSLTSPQKFSFFFLLRDNWKRILLSIILIFITVRFSTELIGTGIKPYIGLFIGMSYDKLGEFLKNKNILK